MKLKRSLAFLVCRMSIICGIFALLAFFGTQTLPVLASGTAFVRIIHATPDVGTVDIFVDGSKLLSNFQYATVTGYVPIPSGAHMVQIALIGKGANAAVITQTISVSPGGVYTVAALGRAATGFSLNVFSDNNIVSSTGNTAKVRVYHLSPGTGAVNVTNGNATVITGLTYTQASNYVTVPAGMYTFDVTTTPNTTLPVPTDLKPWTVTSVFAVGLLNATPKLQIVSTQVPGTPGLPSTGSDPNLHPASVNSQPLMPWLVSFLALVVVGGGVTGVTRQRVAVARKKVRS